MKQFISRILLIAFCATATSSLTSAEAKIAVIQMKKVFEGYWKTKKAEAGIKDEAMKLEQRVQAMTEERQKLIEQHQRMTRAADDPALSATERVKRKQSAEAKLLEIREVEKAVQEFDQRARAQLIEQRKNLTDKLVAEISDAVSAKAKAQGFTLVIDSSGMTGPSQPVIVFFSGKDDLTETILKDINETDPDKTSSPKKIEPKK